MDNISYIFQKTQNLLANPVKKDWNDFSLCEKIIIESIGKKKNMSLGSVINAVGSSQGGGFLAALLQKFHVSSYHGFDTEEHVELFCQHSLKKKNCKVLFYPSPITDSFAKEQVCPADTVFALDFRNQNSEENLFFDPKTLRSAWEKVKNHGHLILSFKLMPKSEKESLQKVCQFFQDLHPRPSRILGYGQKIDTQAWIPGVFSLQKQPLEAEDSCETEFFFPLELLL